MPEVPELPEEHAVVTSPLAEALDQPDNIPEGMLDQPAETVAEAEVADAMDNAEVGADEVALGDTINVATRVHLPFNLT